MRLPQALIAAGRYSFLLGVVLVAATHRAFADYPLADDVTLLMLVGAVVLYAISRKTLFCVIYFNYVAWWMCLGNTNFMFFRVIWSGWTGDIAAENRIYAVFILCLALTSMLLSRRVTTDDSSVSLPAESLHEPIAVVVLAGLAVLYTVLYLPTIGYGGVYTGAISQETRFDVDRPSILNRMVYAYHLLVLLLVLKVVRTNRGRWQLLAVLVASFFVLTVGGARWPLFMLIVTTFFFLAVIRHLTLLEQMRLPAAIFGIVFLAFQPLLAGLRREGGHGPTIAPLALLAGWAGEYRDGAASLVLLDDYAKEQIARSYVATLFLPVVPRQATSVVGINKDSVATLSGAFFMQHAYGVEHGSIRIGGVLESYFWAGYAGVVVAAVLNGLVVYALDRLRSRRRISFFAAVLAAFGATTLLYYVGSQSSALLAPMFAMVSVYILLKAVQWLVGAPNVAFH